MGGIRRFSAPCSISCSSSNFARCTALVNSIAALNQKPSSNRHDQAQPTRGAASARTAHFCASLGSHARDRADVPRDMVVAPGLSRLGARVFHLRQPLPPRRLYAAAAIGRARLAQYQGKARRHPAGDGRGPRAEPHGGGAAARDGDHGKTQQRDGDPSRTRQLDSAHGSTQRREGLADKRPDMRTGDHQGKNSSRRPSERQRDERNERDGARPAVPPQRNSGSKKPQERGGVQRYVAEAARKFVTSSGKLLTTRENIDFLVEHDIEPDNARMSPFNSQPEMRRIISEYRLRLAFSPRHFLHPFDMGYFDPKGHPLAPMTRSRYARKKREEPLWIMFTTRAAGVSAVVRGLTQRRLAGTLHGALEELGYTLAPGLSDSKAIHGTLWVSMLEPTATASKPADHFGKEVAAALDREWSHQI